MGGHACTWGQDQCPLTAASTLEKQPPRSWPGRLIMRPPMLRARCAPAWGQPGFVTSAACGPFCP